MFRKTNMLLFDSQDPEIKRGGLTLSELKRELDRIIDFDSDETRDFVIKTYWRCVVDKIRQPQGAMQRRWMTPGGRYHGQQAYEGQYIWDTMFMLDSLSRLPSQKETVRDVLRTFWDFQDKWDSCMPEYAHGMIGHGFSPSSAGPNVPHHSCGALIGWGAWRIWKNNGDKTLIREALPHIERYHEWYWRERDLDKIGLVTFGCYIEGAVQGMRDESGYDTCCDTDDFEMIPHPARPEGPKHYSDLYGVPTTAYVILGEKCLQKLAEEFGDKQMVERRGKRIDKSVSAMRKHMWDEELGAFVNIRRDGRKVETPTIGSWMPLLAEVPTKTQAARMASVLSTLQWMTPLPVPTVGRCDPKWEPGRISYLPFPPKRVDHLGQPYNFWRGDVWPPCNYQIADGLYKYGFRELPARICDATIINSIIHDDVNERYDCDTGEPLGVPDYGMSACVIAMILDGLTEKFKAKAKK